MDGVKTIDPSARRGARLQSHYSQYSSTCGRGINQCIYFIPVYIQRESESGAVPFVVVTCCNLLCFLFLVGGGVWSTPGPQAVDPERLEEAPSGQFQVVGGHGDEGEVGLAVERAAGGVGVR